MLVTFPDARATIIPDPYHTIVDIDQEGADARVLAWDADEEILKAAFRSGMKIHAVNAINIFGKELAGDNGKTEPYYSQAKRGVHATNYGGTAHTVAAKCRMTMAEATQFQLRYFNTYPQVKKWHEQIDYDLQLTGGVTNIFGYSINFYQRGSDAFTEALAWKPQSTVARLTEIAMVRLRKKEPRFVQLMQVHDSIVAQVRNDRLSEILRNVYHILHSIEIPYRDPLILPWGIKSSPSSWGECKPDSWGKYL
jgi:DNA polymerase I-like protein with 3'-5' exonuclease and polymerase domains